MISKITDLSPSLSFKERELVSSNLRRNKIPSPLRRGRG